ncbi:HAD-IIIC family phosphatase [Plastoroseomonas hellenica]|uniref:HAD-IIIC family phosphatase n=1 Tax=Plastoroseomonas hellenica TaxID=2687306 RepID=UPI001BA869CF|nr:HAD-IIIC family phosphatase [Plastoroseomonas hellenica]MBR0645968.1 HAD-IIIC family phosphatase [Plastoroseomonas hellenica]
MLNPEDIAKEVATLRQRLAGPKLTLADVTACGQAANRLAEAAEAAAQPVERIALAGDTTLDLLAQAVACALLQEGMLARIFVAPIGTGTQQILDSGSDLHAFRPGMVLLVPDWRSAIAPLPTDSMAAAAAADAAQIDMYRSLWGTLTARRYRVLQQTLVPPPWTLRGVADRRSPASVVRRVEALNEALIDASDGQVTWLEADRLAAQVGLHAWSAPRFHHAAKLGFDPRFLVDYLPWFRGAWRAATGRSKKVLVVDLDDTLWGGTIGDLGVHAVALGPAHGAAGEAFASWQDYLAMLGRRGVILAICSKNAPEHALAGFDHPHAALRRDDFASCVCSWDDKATGLRRIAAELSLGLDALVFADDNPAETALVRQVLPEVETVDLGVDPAQFVQRLEAGHWFDLQALTEADLHRREAYAGRRLALETRTSTADLSSYLSGLQMAGRLDPALAKDLPRIAQLELKTNQFNLTTRRYSQAELATFAARDDRLLLTFSLRDRFANHGLTAAIVAATEGDTLRIDSWVMSCRIFSRSAEQFIIVRLAELARSRGIGTLIGEYAPTARNGVVADLYPRLGFSPSGSGGLWLRPLDRPLDDLACWIAVESDPATHLDSNG